MKKCLLMASFMVLAAVSFSSCVIRHYDVYGPPAPRVYRQSPPPYYRRVPPPPPPRHHHHRNRGRGHGRW